jgi:hypothetical protein
LNGQRVCQECYDKDPERKARKNKASTAATQASSQLSTPQRAASSSLLLLQALTTPERIAHLQNTIKEAEQGQQGRIMLVPQRAQALMCLATAAQPSTTSSGTPGAARVLNFGAEFVHLSRGMLMSPSTLIRDVKRFVEEDTLEAPEMKRIRMDNPLHKRFGDGGPSIEVQEVIYEKVKEASEMNRYLSLRTLRADIFAVTAEDVAKSTLHHWMHQLRVEYGLKKLTGLKAAYAHTAATYWSTASCWRWSGRRRWCWCGWTRVPSTRATAAATRGTCRPMTSCPTACAAARRGNGSSSSTP